jgi:hypothetical protein
MEVNSMTEHEREESEAWPVADPLKTAAMPLAQFVLAETAEGRTRKQAMDKLLRCVEEIRAILARGQFH